MREKDPDMSVWGWEVIPLSMEVKSPMDGDWCRFGKGKRESASDDISPYKDWCEDP